MESIIRSSNSVDIQVCVNTAFLTPQRDVFQKALWGYLSNLLNNNGIYLDRQYTTQNGNLCYLYVFQAPNAHYGVLALELLSSQTSPDVPMVDGSTILCSVSAAQWSGDSLSYLGVPFPGLWTANDLLLWGACLLSVLFLCMSGLCCFAMCRAPLTKVKKTDVTSSSSHSSSNSGDASILRLAPQKGSKGAHHLSSKA